ncbi:prolyl oligopeptidase family serine peptidase [Xanthomonas sp. NCPPB 2632]|uniref:carboxylesterase family protein n=1 Tax=Xanthomonas sp. NCPPB 2632 TaxID=3240912 RepID=UPI0035169865
MNDAAWQGRLISRATTEPFSTGQHHRQIDATIEKKIECRFLVHVPAQVGTRESWPLLVFLHGMGEGGRNLDAVKIHGPPMIAETDPAFPFIVVCPQSEKDVYFDMDVLNATLDLVLQDFPVDPSQVYLTGLSSGGISTWAWGSSNPERFAAIAPVCGWWRPADAERFKDLPVWAFHGKKDDLILPEQTENMVDAINKAGGNARITLYPEANHNAWSETYANPELYDWLVSHRR